MPLWTGSRLPVPICCHREGEGKQDLRPGWPEVTVVSPDRIVSRTEVDEEVPGPVGHLQEVPHALQVGGQKTGSPPDGGHPPGGDADVAVLSGELEHLPVQVIRALYPGEKG